MKFSRNRNNKLQHYSLLTTWLYIVAAQHSELYRTETLKKYSGESCGGRKGLQNRDGMVYYVSKLLKNIY